MAATKAAAAKGKEVKPKPASTRKAKPKAKSSTGRAVLTGKQLRFVEEYIIDLNATQAAIRAGYSAKTAGQIGDENLRKPQIASAIEESRKKLAERTEITQEAVLRRWWEIATANPNELIEYRRGCCRHCYGEGHAYQWRDEDEHQQAVETAKQEDSEPPSDEGGYGYNRAAKPSADCPKCYGEGYGRVHAHDTRELSPAAAALYAGVKQTKEGLEIKMHDQLKALENVARHLGMFNDKLTLKGDAENPLAILLGQLAGKTLKPVAE